MYSTWLGSPVEMTQSYGLAGMVGLHAAMLVLVGNLNIIILLQLPLESKRFFSSLYPVLCCGLIGHFYSV